MTTNLSKDQLIKLMLEENCCEQISKKLRISIDEANARYNKILSDFSCRDIKEFRFKYLHHSI